MNTELGIILLTKILKVLFYRHFNYITTIFSLFHDLSSSKEWYLLKYPDQLLTLLGKVFVFCYTWAVGGNLKREDDSDDDGGISVAQRNGGGGPANKKTDVPDLNIAYEFDTFVHDMFDTEPPLGTFSC